ncbi:MAG: plasmid pRiA4b ORF-3 family protein [Phycisphaerae bacterium]
MAKRRAKKRKRKPRDNRLFELEVGLLSGPVTEEFAKRNPVVSRTIQIRGDQTLTDLHEAIFDAFGRDEEHMYEFQVGGKRPMDPKADRYVMPMALDYPLGDSKPDGDVTCTTIGSIGLKVDQVFGYWFDFGDDWWHRITVRAVHEEAPAGKYPQVTASVGESPPQYIGGDEDEYEDEDEDED